MAKISLLSGNGNQTTITGISLALSGHFISSGILKKDYLLVTENDTPNNTVKVDIGAAVIGFDDYTGDQDKFYYFFVDTPENVTIGANSSGNPRIDAIVAYVDTANPASDDNDGAGVLIAIEGTPAGSPSAPTDSDIQTELGAGVRWIRLANVEVSNGFSSIVDGDITDTRVKARATGNSIYDNNDAVKGYDSGGSIRDLLKLNSGDNIEIGGAGIGNINLNNTLVSNIINSLGGIIWDGWQPRSETLTYASATSFTIAGVDLTAIYRKGTKLRVSQSTGGTKYFVVASSSFSTNTTVNLIPTTDYSLANEAISSPNVSYAENPAGWPGWFAYTPTFTGFSAAPVGIHRWSARGNTIHLIVRVVTFGTSDATGFTITAPIAQANVSADLLTYFSLGLAVDNGSNSSGDLGRIPNNSATITLLKGASPTGWTNSGNKGANFQFFYQF